MSQQDGVLSSQENQGINPYLEVVTFQSGSSLSTNSWQIQNFHQGTYPVLPFQHGQYLGEGETSTLVGVEDLLNGVHVRSCAQINSKVVLDCSSHDGLINYRIKIL